MSADVYIIKLSRSKSESTTRKMFDDSPKEQYSSESDDIDDREISDYYPSPNITRKTIIKGAILNNKYVITAICNHNYVSMCGGRRIICTKCKLTRINVSQIYPTLHKYVQRVKSPIPAKSTNTMYYCIISLWNLFK